jgi:hypothetical protein
MLRSLVGYTHKPSAAGNQLVGDLATSVPQPTDGGKTYTYHLRDGSSSGRFRQPCCDLQDVAYAMNRLANPDDGGQYSYYKPIVGWDAVANGKAKTVSVSPRPTARRSSSLLTPIGVTSTAACRCRRPRRFPTKSATARREAR